ncbi:MAG: GIY-YIG nuclease family protein [Oscillospiraceae bacterium]|jgi:hypothetical protein|nr:GIY-YIG nuclease family protein [Oscillospiraceae bacterium]
MAKSNGIVYILTNPCLDGWTKIGMSERNDINKRLTELNTPSNIPLSYRAYAVYEVSDPKVVEKEIHKLIDVVDGNLHARETLASGRIRQREFFKISAGRAYSIFQSVARLRKEEAQLKRILPNEEQLDEEEIVERAIRRPPFRFDMVGIPEGAELTFIYDEGCVCTVAPTGNKVIYCGKSYSLSRLAGKLLVEKRNWSSADFAQGPLYFLYDGKTLSEWRKIKEEGIECEE